MKYINVHVLWPGGHTDWRIIPWGKRHLDAIRNSGGTIIGYHTL